MGGGEDVCVGGGGRWGGACGGMGRGEGVRGVGKGRVVCGVRSETWGWEGWSQSAVFVT